MTLKVSPESPYDPGILEFAAIEPITVTITDEEAGGGSEENPTSPINHPVVITTVTVPDTGIKATFVDNTFTLTGSFNDVFSRALAYRDGANAIQSAAQFSGIPIGFNTLFKYTAPTETQKDVVVTVTFETQAPIQYVVVVHEDYATANAKLVTAVKEGRF